MHFAAHLLASLALAGTTAVVVVAMPAGSVGGGRESGFSWADTEYLLAFGDSYTFVQGTAGFPNFSFIGDQLNFSFEPRTLLEDLIVQNQTGTAEGGPNWVEFITDCAVKPGFHSPFSCPRQLWDFAFAGADISVEFTPLHHNNTISFVNQILQFETYGEPALHNIIKPSRTLVAIWIGINDISDTASNTTITSFPALYDAMHTAMFNSVQTLYSLGFRSYLFMNLPPLDRTPGNQKSANPRPNATMVDEFNEALSTHAAAFQAQNEDVNVMVFDANTVLNGVLDDPSKFGIVNVTDFCPGFDQPDINTNFEAYGCPTPLSEYFWYNSGHMTSRTHQILAGALEPALRNWKR